MHLPVFRVLQKYVQSFITSLISLEARRVVEIIKDPIGAILIEGFLSSQASAEQKLEFVIKYDDELSYFPSSWWLVHFSLHFQYAYHLWVPWKIYNPKISEANIKCSSVWNIEGFEDILESSRCLIRVQKPLGDASTKATCPSKRKLYLNYYL